MDIPETLDALRVPVGSLKPYSRNARQGDVGLIVSSLERLGQFRPIVVNARTQEVLAGNHTLRAARELGWQEIAATFVDVDEDVAARINLVDNRANDLATYDDHALADLLRTLPDLEGTGYDGDALDELLADLGADGRSEGDTDPMDPPAEPRTQVGDLYVLGDHRLLCGDAADADDVSRLLAASVPDIVVTDPPYGVKYESAGRTRRYDRSTGNYGPAGKQHRDIANDWDDAAALVHDALSISALRPGGVFYIFAPTGPAQLGFMVAIAEAYGSDALRQGLVWLKDSMVFGRSDYHYRHEAILYGWVPGAAHYFVEDRTQTSVWECARPSVSDEHPTMKPVELVERAVRNSSKPGDLLYDPFTGSGTAALAAENLGRRAQLMEIDPGYCDVIVDRWERHTGKSAERIRDGETVEVHA